METTNVDASNSMVRSPSGLYSIERRDFGEIGMGSPLYGHMTIQGVDGSLPDRLYGEVAMFSADS